MSVESREVAKIGSLVSAGDFQKAEKFCRKLLKKNKHSEVLTITLIRVLIAKKDEAGLVKLTRKIRRLFPGRHNIHKSLAILFKTQGMYNLAIEEYQISLSHTKNDLGLYIDAASLNFHLRLYNRTIEILNEAIGSFPDSSELWLMLGATYQALQKLDLSLQNYLTAHRLSDKNIDAITGIANIYFLQRKNKIALSYLKPVIDHSPPASAIVLYVQICVAERMYDEASNIATTALATQTISKKQRAMLLYSLGNLNDKKGKYSEAFRFYEEANRMEDTFFNRAETENYFNNIQYVFSRDAIESKKLKKDSSPLVFIVGMPRSGSSLTEQILSMHPDVFAAGELNTLPDIINSVSRSKKISYPEVIDYLEQDELEEISDKYLQHQIALKKNKRLITDKLPDNFIHLGLINILFPDAKIVHCIRNPADTCISCYFQQFSGDYPYAYNLENLGNYYLMYNKIMKYWKETLSIDIHEVKYENLVTNKEKEIRKLIEFCGLDWHDSCLDFSKSKRVVTTASSHQVDKSLYKTSVNRWKNYASYTDSLIKILVSNDYAE